MDVARRAKKLGLGVVFAVTAAVAPTQPASALDHTHRAPSFELPAVAGMIKLDNYRGQIVYVDFWASWCGPCKQSFPWMNAMQTKYGAQGFKVIGIDLDADSADGRRFLARTPVNFDVAFDPTGSSARLYGIKGMPSSVLLDRDGKVIYEHVGFNDTARAEFEKLLESLLASSQ
jgi:thiol-disulfide isomerase/thioredoxin